MFYSESKLNMNRNKFLVVKGRAGLGNRMLSALTGILYARLSGRKLIIDWTDPTYSNDGDNVFHNFFRCPFYDSNDTIPETDSVSPSIWRGQLRKSATDMSSRYGNQYDSQIWRKFSIDLTKLDYPEDVVVMWTYTHKVELLRSHFTEDFEEFSRLETKDILRKVLRETLILHPQISERVTAFKNDKFEEKTVAVHVRYSDHRTSIRSTLKTLNTLLNVEPDLQIFLATDNLNIKKLFEDIYSNVITMPHWYPAPGLKTHQNEKCQNRMENGIEALIDLYLLAECDYLVIDTSSSFSYVASLLTKVPGKNVFDVRTRGKRSARFRKITWRIMVMLGLFNWGLNGLSKLMKIIEPIKVRTKR
jgi:hypothetical protein